VRLRGFPLRGPRDDRLGTAWGGVRCPAVGRPELCKKLLGRTWRLSTGPCAIDTPVARGAAHGGELSQLGCVNAAGCDLVRSSELVIERPRGSCHPRHPAIVYPLDYGYLKSTSSSDVHGSPMQGRGKCAVARCCMDRHFKRYFCRGVSGSSPPGAGGWDCW
jgi:hypothetical protein